MEAKTDDSSYVIEIDPECDLLEDTVSLVPPFALLCATESRALMGFSDAGLSRGIAGMTLRVSLLLYLFYVF